MRKQLVIIGIVAILVCVGLSGCTQNGSKYITAGDIRNHPNSYINQSVVLKGQYYGEGQMGFMDSSGSFPITIPANVQKPTPLVTGGIYVFTGIVRYGQLPNSVFGPELYLEVTKIETT